MENIIDIAKKVLKIEADAVAALAEKLDSTFEKAIDIIFESKGRVVVTGMGKSGLVGKKIAATLASTGTPAFFMHPAEASHGDLGMVTSDDVIIAISNSGETAELSGLIPFLKRFNVSLIAMTGSLNSTLAKSADVHLDVSVKEEACPLGVVPTASTTAALAMGDAIAVALLVKRGLEAGRFCILSSRRESREKTIHKSQRPHAHRRRPSFCISGNRNDKGGCGDIIKTARCCDCQRRRQKDFGCFN